MSLIKRPTMTEKKVATNRRNQNLCNAPLTDMRRERIRAALRRFGYNVQATAPLEKTAALHDVLETKGITYDEQKSCKNLSYWKYDS